jgi:ABC-type transporter Mla MlaB component
MCNQNLLPVVSVNVADISLEVWHATCIIESVGGMTMGGGVDSGEREGRMTEHENDTRMVEAEEGLRLGDVPGAWAATRGRDLVLDLSGLRELDAPNLSLLMTVQQKAQKEHRAIWLTRVPYRVWETLHALGLDRLFRAFPVSGAMDV